MVSKEIEILAQLIAWKCTLELASKFYLDKLDIMIQEYQKSIEEKYREKE